MFEYTYIVRPALKPSCLTASLVEADLRCSIRIPDRARPGHFSSLGRATSRCVESESTESAESRVEQGSRLSGSPLSSHMHWGNGAHDISFQLPQPQEPRPPVLSSIEQPHAGTLSQAGPHDNNKDQFESGSKMQKLVLSMP